MSALNEESLATLLASLGEGVIIGSSTASQPWLQPLYRPTDLYRASAIQHLMQATDCAEDVAYNAIQVPTTLDRGDLSIPTPRLRSKDVKPSELAIKVASMFSDDHALFRKAAATGIHVPLFFSQSSLSRLVVPYVFQMQATYGHVPFHGVQHPSAPEPGRKKVIVEFSSPNIAKEFHAGHLRSTIIGAFIANLYTSMGWDVVKINYLGDWGKQFGLLAVGWQRYGSEEELAFEPLKHLLSVYARINSDFRPEQEASKQAREQGRDASEIESKGLFAERNQFFRRMEDGDPEALALWKRFRDISIERYVSTYSRLNIDFDEYSGESQVKTASIEAVEKMLRDKDVYEEKDGSWMIDFEKRGYKGLGTAVVRGRTGTTTYLLRDVAAVIEREEKYKFDKMIYAVSSEQDLYFQRLFRTIELIGRSDLADRLQHVNFGKVMGMSSRMGTVKLLSDILDQSREAMHDVMRKNEVKYAQVLDPDAVAEAVGISAIMVQDMSGKRINNYTFDMSHMTSFEGDTGPYLQYCHARLNSILRKAGVTRHELVEFMARHPGALDADARGVHCRDLLRLMAQYPDVTSRALDNLEPSTILTYLFRLTHQLSSCYDVLQVVGAPGGHDAMMARAALYEAARQVLENGMRLLGLNPVERM